MLSDFLVPDKHDFETIFEVDLCLSTKVFKFWICMKHLKEASVFPWISILPQFCLWISHLEKAPKRTKHHSANHDFLDIPIEIQSSLVYHSFHPYLPTSWGHQQKSRSSHASRDLQRLHARTTGDLLNFGLGKLLQRLSR